MSQHVFRLTRGQDLRQEINQYVKMHQIEAAVLICGVGCVSAARIRKADGVSIHEEVNRFEIVSLQGTVSMNGSHIHIALSDNDLRTIGGHLMDGCIVNTTAEIIVFEMPNHRFDRKFDENTGYNELFVEYK